MTKGIFAALILILSGCSRYPSFNSDYMRIAVGPGPEDIALDTLGTQERLIISCSERRTEEPSKNGMYDYDLNTETLRKLPIEGFPKSVSLRPHGIDIGVVEGKKLLYCVNHENDEKAFPPKGRQSILIFELQEMKLVFLEQLTDKLLISPNDLCVDNKGGIYVSNDSGKRNNFLEKLFALRKSTIVHYNGDSWKNVGHKYKYANGVGVNDGRLYVTGTQEKVIYSYRIEEDGSLSDESAIVSMKGNDNVTFTNHQLVTTAHLDFLAFMRHVKDADSPSPSMVYSIDLKNLEMDTLFLDKGNVLSAASTGLVYQNNLYIAQVFNPFILRIQLGH